MDIGTAQGCFPVQVARLHHHISGGGFDLPELSTAFGDYVRENKLSGRLCFHPGSFFEDDLPAADVLVFGRVLHNWDLATKKMLDLAAFLKFGPLGLAGLLLVLMATALTLKLNEARERLILRILYVGAFCYVVASASAMHHFITIPMRTRQRTCTKHVTQAR
jgi:hypothetical protein